MAAREDASTRNRQPEQEEPDHYVDDIEVKVSGDGNGLVDDETSGHAMRPVNPSPGQTANERRAGEGDADATSQ